MWSFSSKQSAVLSGVESKRHSWKVVMIWSTNLGSLSITSLYFSRFSLISLSNIPVIWSSYYFSSLQPTRLSSYLIISSSAGIILFLKASLFYSALSNSSSIEARRASMDEGLNFSGQSLIASSCFPRSAFFLLMSSILRSISLISFSICFASSSICFILSYRSGSDLPARLAS